MRDSQRQPCPAIGRGNRVRCRMSSCAREDDTPTQVGYLRSPASVRHSSVLKSDTVKSADPPW